MKKQLLLLAGMAIGGLIGPQQCKAQWTTAGSIISQTDTTKKVSIGTKSNTSDLYVSRNNAASSIGVRSGTGNAILNMDKGSVGSNSAVAYKSLGVTSWNTGMLGNNNYSIKNVPSGTFPLVVTSTDRVGIGTATPLYKLDVNGDASFYGVRVGRGNNAVPENTAIGDSALSQNTTGYDNTACGHQALQKNLDGGDNSAFGSLALKNNTSGEGNVATGGNSLRENTTGLYNTASGAYSLTFNTTGELNTANGNSALISNRTGSYNTACGGYALNDNYDGNYNTASGYEALYKNISATGNTAMGYEALYNFIPSINNSGFGTYADMTTNGLFNSTAIGYNAKVNSNNKIRLGDANVTVIEGQVAYTFPSDARFKYNIKDNIPGLAFINQLNPVTYNFDTKKFEAHLMQNMEQKSKEERMKNRDFSASSKIVHSGFLAQDIEKICKQLGYDFDGLHVPDADNNTDNYSLAYSQFIMPLVKAVQELDAKNDVLFRQNEEMKNEISNLKEAVLSCCQNGSGSGKEANTISADGSKTVLFQNQPNPFNQATLIRYMLSSANSKGVIVIRDLGGNQVKSVSINNTGIGQVTVHAKELSPGTYTYTLEIAGESIDTKLMVVTK